MWVWQKAIFALICMAKAISLCVLQKETVPWHTVMSLVSCRSIANKKYMSGLYAANLDEVMQTCSRPYLHVGLHYNSSTACLRFHHELGLKLVDFIHFFLQTQVYQYLEKVFWITRYILHCFITNEITVGIWKLQKKNLFWMHLPRPRHTDIYQYGDLHTV